MSLLKIIIISLVLLPSSGLRAETCEHVTVSTEIDQLSEKVQEITGEVALKVLTLKVTHDGTGAVKLLLDDEGNLAAIRFDYKSADGSIMQETKTVEQFNKGEAVSMSGVDGNADPLVLKKSPNVSVSKSNGGPFTLSLLSSTDPVKYTNYEIKVAKVGKDWKLTKDNKVITSTTLSPNISWSLSWEGTFKGASFQ